MSSTETEPKHGGDLLQLENVTMRYGAIAALQDVSLGVAAGEVVALLGDNGAGKSTAIKIISGSVKPTSGRLVFEGIPREFESPRASKELGIEIVYQDLSMSAPLNKLGGVGSPANALALK